MGGRKSHNSLDREISLEVGHNFFPPNWDCIYSSGTLSEEDWKPPLPAYDFLQMMEPSVPELSPHTPPHPGDTTAQHPPQNRGGDPAGGDSGSREEPSQDVGSPGRGLRGTAPRLAARDKQGKRHSEL